MKVVSSGLFLVGGCRCGDGAARHDAAECERSRWRHRRHVYLPPNQRATAQCPCAQCADQFPPGQPRGKIARAFEANERGRQVPGDGGRGANGGPKRPRTQHCARARRGFRARRPVGPRRFPSEASGAPGNYTAEYERRTGYRYRRGARRGSFCSVRPMKSKFYPKLPWKAMFVVSITSSIKKGGR
jgi:hypothetical protein